MGTEVLMIPESRTYKSLLHSTLSSSFPCYKSTEKITTDGNWTKFLTQCQNKNIVIPLDPHCLSIIRATLLLLTQTEG